VIFSVFFVFVALAVFLFTWERPREEIASIAPRDTGGSAFHVITDLFHELWATLRIRAFACTSACTSVATSARTS
jgi:predicted PurR-regulated permease PerM